MPSVFPYPCYYLVHALSSSPAGRTMLDQAIWWSTIALELLLFVRGFQSALVSRYPVFYTYISFVLLQELLRFSVYRWDPTRYPAIYWPTEFLGVVIGCGVIFEIYRVGLAAYPGTAKMARAVLLFVFAFACIAAFADSSRGHVLRIPTVWQLERNIRAVQALAIAALVGLFLSYSVRVGKNLLGMLLGYGLFVGVSVFQLTFVSPAGNRFSDFWSYLHPLSYDAALIIWATYLWVHKPCPVPNANMPLEQGYQRIASGTQRRLQEMRRYLRRVVRQ